MRRLTGSSRSRFQWRPTVQIHIQLSSNARLIEPQAVDSPPQRPIRSSAMQRQIQILRQLVLDSQYAVDESTVAAAIIARATARRTVLGTTFRNDTRSPDTGSRQVRSFRPSSQARSFRPCNVKHAEDGLLTIAPWRRP